MPVSPLKPLSSAKMACLPPPRSSVPRTPQRLGDKPPELRATLFWPFGPVARLWLLYSILASTTPYKVTDDWAAAAALAIPHARATRLFFIGLLLLRMGMDFSLLCLCAYVLNWHP